MNRSIHCLSLLLCLLFFSACQKEHGSSKGQESQDADKTTDAKAAASDTAGNNKSADENDKNAEANGDSPSADGGETDKTAATNADKEITPENDAVDDKADAAPGEEKAKQGILRGKVKIKGTPPTMELLNRASDPFCAKTKVTAPWVKSKNGGLGDVLVRLPVGAVPDALFPKSIAVRQKNCMYAPYVSGIQSGGKILIKNADQVLHNVHTYLGDETLFNLAQRAGGEPIKYKAGDAQTPPGSVVRLGCDIHNWMAGYVVVTDHPFFTTSDVDGSFEMAIPPGSYELEAWHPHFGVQKAKVKVKAGETAEVTIEFPTSSFKKPK